MSFARFLYVASAGHGGLLRVGFAVNPHRRVTAMRAANPDIRLVYTHESTLTNRHHRAVHRVLTEKGYAVAGAAYRGWYRAPLCCVQRVVIDQYEKTYIAELK